MEKSNKQSFFSKVGKTFWIGVIILVILLLLSFALLSVDLYKLSKANERAVDIKSDMFKELDVFSMSYENDKGEITVESRFGDKVIAPGTEETYYIRLKNDDRYALDYTCKPTVSVIDDVYIPVEVRLINPNGYFIIGNKDTWVNVTEVAEKSETRTFKSGDFDEYIFQWRWKFESGDDALDTELGNMKDSPILEVKFEITSSVNTTISENGGIMASGVGRIILNSIVIIILIGAIVVLFVYTRKKVKKRNQ